MTKTKVIAVLLLLMCLAFSMVTPAYADSLRDKKIRLGLDSILLGYYTDVGPAGEPETLIGLTLLGVGYRKYLELRKPLYGYFEFGTQALILPYLEGGIIFAFPFGLELKTGLNLALGMETITDTYSGETIYSFYPLLGLGLGIGVRF